MIRGFVEPNLEATLPVEVQGPAGVERIDAVIDTGFSAALSLPADLIARLGLVWDYTGRATLANGAEVPVEVYLAEIEWHGEWREIQVDEANTDPLVGMRLLRGGALHIDVTEGGGVAIHPLPADA